MPAETQRIRHTHVQIMFPGCIGDVIKIALRIGMLVINGGKNHLILYA
jgi:hypothetical protein